MRNLAYKNPNLCSKQQISFSVDSVSDVDDEKMVFVTLIIFFL